MKYIRLTTLLASLVFPYAYVQAQTSNANTVQIEQTKVVSGHLETALYFAEGGELSLSVSASTCPAKMGASTVVAPARAILYVQLQGNHACLVTLDVGNAAGNSVSHKFEIGASGEEGINLILKGNGGFAPANSPLFSGDTSVELFGGYGDLHLDGKASLGVDSPIDARLLLQYQDTRLFLADSNGWPITYAGGAVAGDVGPGIYASQDIGWFRVGAAYPFTAQPFGQPRLGIGVKLPYVCANTSTNIWLADPIVALEVGYGNFLLGGQFRPSHPDTNWNYNAAYKDLSWEVNLNGTEHDASTNFSGYVNETPFGWLTLAGTANLSSTGISGTAALDSLNFGLAWRGDSASGQQFSIEGRLYDLIPDVLLELDAGANITFSAQPGLAYIGSLWKFSEPLKLDTKFSVDTDFKIGSNIALSYTVPFEGLLSLAAELNSTNLRVADTIYGGFKINYASPIGFQTSLELLMPFTNPSGIVINLKLASWSFISSPPPAPSVREVAVDYSPPAVSLVPCR